MKICAVLKCLPHLQIHIHCLYMVDIRYLLNRNRAFGELFEAKSINIVEKKNGLSATHDSVCIIPNNNRPDVIRRVPVH